MKYNLEGTVQRDFLSPIFSLMESSQVPFSVFNDFSNLASNLVRYSRFLIDSRQYFIAESPYSLYCLLWRVVTLRIILAGSHHLLALSALTLACCLLRRVVTLRIILAGSHHLLALSALTLACCLIRRVNTPCIDCYRESLLPASFTAGSHC